MKQFGKAAVLALAACLCVFALCASAVAAEGSEIADVALRKSENTVSVTLTAQEGGDLFVAFYGEDGMFLGCETETVKASPDEQTVMVHGLERLERSGTVKAFLLDRTNGRPLCESKHQILDVSVYAILSGGGDDGKTLTFYSTLPAGRSLAEDDVWRAESSDAESIPWADSREEITTVSFAEPVAPTSTACWFLGCSYLASIEHIERLDTSEVTDMCGMFYHCYALTSLDLKSFDTSSVTDMSSMFTGCDMLTSLDLSGFDTSNVTDMSEMFRGCTKLAALDLKSFSTSSVTDMSSMFFSCKALTALDLKSFDTSKVTDMGSMFVDCEALTRLDLKSFDTSNVTDMSIMFNYCRALTALDLSSFDTSNVADMSDMFSFCKALTTLDLKSFDTSNVTNMRTMFSSCQALTTLDLSGFDTSNVTDMGYMFFNCYGLTSLDLSGFSAYKVTDTGGMFSGCSKLTAVYASERFDATAVKDSGKMFMDCTALAGGNGTAYDKDHTDAGYARIDGGAGAPGYFTAKDTTA